MLSGQKQRDRDRERGEALWLSFGCLDPVNKQQSPLASPTFKPNKPQVSYRPNHNDDGMLEHPRIQGKNKKMGGEVDVESVYTHLPENPSPQLTSSPL